MVGRFEKRFGSVVVENQNQSRIATFFKMHLKNIHEDVVESESGRNDGDEPERGYEYDLERKRYEFNVEPKIRQHTLEL